MEPLDFTRCRALNNIPAKKLREEISFIQSIEEPLSNKNIKIIAINRYYESNIPIEYWKLTMNKDFIGDPRLKQKFDEYTNDLKQSYITGSSLCLAGGHGQGKTFAATSILKKACQKGYSCLYIILSDAIAVLTQSSNEDKFLARRELSMVDFLVIDELDPRFYSTENAADLFARSLEGIFRVRSANKLPTIMCTNSPNIVESFNGQLKASMSSLFKGHMKMFPVFGVDHRSEVR